MEAIYSGSGAKVSARGDSNYANNATKKNCQEGKEKEKEDRTADRLNAD